MRTGPDFDWDGIARSGLTLVVLMGVATLPAICCRLIDAGLDPHTPAASISDGGLPSQQSVRGTLASIAADAEAAGILTAITQGRAHDPEAVMNLYTAARRKVSREALAPPTQVDFTPDGY